MNEKTENLEQKINDLETALRLKEKQINNLKSVFLRHVPHEIRTPMNSITGFLDLLVNDEPDPLVKKQYLEYIQSSSQELVRIFDYLIDLSMLESSQLLLQEKATVLKDLFDDLYNRFNMELEVSERNSLVLLNELPPGREDTTMYADRDRLKQVLTILLENSIKFTQKGLIEFGFQPQIDKTVKFFVKDTGMGINELEKEQLFLPFHKNADSVNEISRGLGLGLALARGLIKQMGGELDARRNVDQGTIFTFALPLVPANLSLENISLSFHKKQKTKTIRIEGRDLAI